MKTLSLVFCLMLISAGSLACQIAPPGSAAAVHRLVSDSSAIVIATVQSEAHTTDVGLYEFTFSIEEVLKGRVREPLRLVGYSPRYLSEYNADYDGHQDPGFWAGTQGNAGINTLCNIYGFFAVGETYLLFLGGKPHFKAFENVKSDEDFWLQVVRAAIEKFE